MLGVSWNDHVSWKDVLFGAMHALIAIIKNRSSRLQVVFAPDRRPVVTVLYCELVEASKPEGTTRSRSETVKVDEAYSGSGLFTKAKPLLEETTTQHSRK